MIITGILSKVTSQNRLVIDIDYTTAQKLKALTIFNTPGYDRCIIYPDLDNTRSPEEITRIANLVGKKIVAKCNINYLDLLILEKIDLACRTFPSIPSSSEQNIEP